MKTHTFTLFCFLSLAPLTLWSAGGPAIPAAELWDRIEQLQKSPEPEAKMVDGEMVPTKEYLEASSKRAVAITDLLMQFVEQYPKDSRHWDAVAALGRTHREMYKTIGDDIETRGWEAAQSDVAASQAWSKRVAAHVNQMFTAAGVSAKNREAAYEYVMGHATRGDKDSMAAYAEERRMLDRMRAEFPQSQRTRVFEWQLLNRLRKLDPAAVPAQLQKLAADSNPEIAKWAQGELTTESLRQQPIEMAFTALDGRKVDLAQLRGKVVLVDFWATWCGPCVAELPNVLDVYNKLNAQGFEVVGISLDNADDRQKLVDFVASRKLPWPQFFNEEKDKKNPLAEKYGVTAIPAMFLFDKTGRLVDTSARGEKLEPQVRKLLEM